MLNNNDLMEVRDQCFVIVSLFQVANTEETLDEAMKSVDLSLCDSKGEAFTSLRNEWVRLASKTATLPEWALYSDGVKKYDLEKLQTLPSIE